MGTAATHGIWTAAQNAGAALMVINGTDSNRGPFTCHRTMKIRDILDGMSNTVLMAERDLGNPSNNRDILGRVQGNAAASPNAAQAGVVAGFYPTTATFGALPLMSERWACGLPYFSAVTIAAPPNSASSSPAAAVTVTSAATAATASGWYTPSSRHTGGVHCLMGDGTVRFVNETINSATGTPTCTAAQTQAATTSAACNGQSPFGIWGALGTMASGETVNDF